MRYLSKAENRFTGAWRSRQFSLAFTRRIATSRLGFGFLKSLFLYVGICYDLFFLFFLCRKQSSRDPVNRQCGIFQKLRTGLPGRGDPVNLAWLLLAGLPHPVINCLRVYPQGCEFIHRQMMEIKSTKFSFLCG